MHELRIAESVMNIALKEMDNRNLAAITAIGLRVGALSGVNPDALEFGFQAITTDTKLSGTKLVIEEVPVKGTCRVCKRDFEVTEFVFVCPLCFSGDIEVTQGEELDIAYLETE